MSFTPKQLEKLEKLEEFLEDEHKTPTEVQSEAERKSGLSRLRCEDGLSMRFNSVTNQGAALSCGGCGTWAAKMKTCSGCGSIHYCSRECQKAHWSEHKPRCKGSFQEPGSFKRHEVQTTEIMKWLTNMPGMTRLLAESAKQQEESGCIISIAQVNIGKNDSRCALTAYHIDTVQKLESLHTQFPEYTAALRLEPPAQLPLRRIVVIATVGDYTSVMRLRVAVPEDAVGAADAAPREPLSNGSTSGAPYVYRLE